MTRQFDRARKLLLVALAVCALVLVWELLPAVLSGCGRWERALLRDDPAAWRHALQPSSDADPDHARTISVRSLGHCTMVITQDAHTLVTDPVLAPRMGGTFRRWNKAPGLDSLPPCVDAILITHFHADHFSRRTLARMDRQAMVIGPRGVERRLHDRSRRVVELLPWQSVEVACWRITAVPAHHPTGRNPAAPYDPATTTGYVIEGPGPTIYVSGDTEFGTHLAEIGRRFDVNLALINVNLHLPGPQAEMAANDVGAEVWAPIHWGAYPVFDGLPTQRQLADLRARLVPAGRMVWLRPGDTARFAKPPVATDDSAD